MSVVATAILIWLLLLPIGAESNSETCHKLNAEAEAAVGLPGMAESDLKEFFGCSSGGLAAGSEDGDAWFSQRLPTENLQDYKLGAFNFNGFQGGFDTWRSAAGDVAAALQTVHDAYPDNDPFVLDYGYRGCFGPLAEFCLRALREYQLFHSGSRDAGGDRHGVELGINLSHDEAKAGFSFWDIAKDALTGVIRAPFDFVGDLVGKPKAFCQASQSGELQLAGDMVRTGALAYQELQAISRRIWAAQRAALAAAGQVGFSDSEPVLKWTPSAGNGDFEIEFRQKDQQMLAIAYRVETRTSFSGQVQKSRNEVDRHAFAAPLIWAIEQLQGWPIVRVKVAASCRETRPDLHLREFTATWSYIAKIAEADPWLKLLAFYPADRESASFEIDSEARLTLVATLDDWRRLVRWDRLYRLAFRAEATAIDAAFPPAARDELRLQRKLTFTTKHSAVLVVLRRAELDLAKIMGQGIYRDSLSLRQLLTNPKAVAAKVLLDSSPLRKLALCTPGPSQRMGDPALFRHDARSRLDELCELPHRLTLADNKTTLPEFLKIEGFVAVAFAAPKGQVRVARFQLPNTFLPDNPAATIFQALTEAPAGLPTGANLWPEGSTDKKPELYLASLAKPGAAAVNGPFQKKLWQQTALTPAPVKTNGIFLAYSQAGEPLQMYVGQWLLPKRQTLPRWPDRLNVSGQIFSAIAPEAGAGLQETTRFYSNRDNDRWVVVSKGDWSDSDVMFQVVTVMEFCQGGCA